MVLETADVRRMTSIPEEQARYQAAMRKYQREKGPPLHIEGLQPFILKPDASRAFGRHARRENILAARVVGELVRSSLGPKGMKKMLVDNDGLIWVTSDGATLLSKMDFQHPVAKLMVEVAQAVHREVGDGATSTVLLASELLKRSDDMVQQGLHPTAVSEGYIKAGKEALRVCRKIAISVNPTDTSVLRNVASTALCGRMNDKNIAHFSTVATDAALSAMHRVRTKYDIDLSDVNVEKKVGGSLAEARLVDGFAFCRELAHPAMPRTAQDAKVAVLQGQLKLDKRGRSQYEHVYTIQHVDDAKRLTDGRLRVLQEMVGRLVNVGANVVVLEKGIDPTVADILARHSVMVIRRVVIEDLERIAKATGARVVSHVEDLSADDLGSAKTVTVRKVGGDDWTFIEGCVNPKCVTILIRGATERLTDEAERSLIGAVTTLRTIMQRPLIAAGGGAVEIELAAQLRRWGERIAGRRQLPILNFAEALETLVSILIENGGREPLDILPMLRARHRNGERGAGIDLSTGEVKDMIRAHIYEPLAVKEQIVKSAVELTVLILRISDYIAARELEKPERYAKELEEAQKPEEKKKIYKDYKVPTLEPR